MNITDVSFLTCIEDLINQPQVRAMATTYPHNRTATCLEHCMLVAYISFRICRLLGLDYRAAARGGLLHDLYLYDWRKKGSHKGLHGFRHPKIALQNAKNICELNQIEADIIVKHMWPLTLELPHYKESFVVIGIDKLCAAAELAHVYSFLHTKKRMADYVGKLLQQAVLFFSVNLYRIRQSLFD